MKSLTHLTISEVDDLFNERPRPVIVENKALPWTNFCNQDLRGVQFIGCDLNGIDFANANCEGVHFINCDLSKSYFNESNLSGAIFQNCYFKDAVILNISHLNKGITLIDTELSHTFISNCCLINSTITKTKFNNNTLYKVDLTKSNLTDVSFKYCTISQVDFSNSKLPKTCFFGDNSSLQTLTHCKFNHSDLCYANFVACELIGCEFTKAELINSGFSIVIFTKCSLAEALLCDSHFDFCSATEGLIFEKADLRATKYVWCEFENLDLTGANLGSAKMRKTQVLLDKRSTFTNDQLDSLSLYEESSIQFEKEITPIIDTKEQTDQRANQSRWSYQNDKEVYPRTPDQGMPNPSKTLELGD